VSVRQLFDRHYPALVRFLYRRLGDRDQAEELAQEAFFRLLEQRPDRPRPWLFAVAANLARDVARGAVRRTRHLQVLGGELAGRSPPDPEELLLRGEVAQRVRAALDALSERDRTLLLLRQEGLAYREIAAVLEISATSVGPLLTRAQRRFVQCYQDPEQDERQAGASG
jgi:RNA polymerase sigma-70 factor (ECF subfamily)